MVTRPRSRGTMPSMSQRIDKSWTVLQSIENDQHDRCVDVFRRPDGSFGFEEFRRDAEDAGAWTPVRYYAGRLYPSAAATLAAARRVVPWLDDILGQCQATQASQ